MSDTTPKSEKQVALLKTILAKLKRGESDDKHWPDSKGEYWALCPYHNDQNAKNFNVSLKGFNCFACGENGSLYKLAKKLGIEIETDHQGLTLEAYADAKGLKVEFLRSEGLRDQLYFKTPSVRIAYYSADGRETAARYRLALQKGASDNRFRWQKGSKVQPYGLNHLAQAQEAGYIVLVEGESDAQTLWQAGFPALGIPGADTWHEDWSSYLENIKRIYVVIEPDQGGETVRGWLAKSKIRERTMLIGLGEHKDPSGLYLSDRENFANNWRAAMDAAVQWSTVELEQKTGAAQEAYELAKDLLHDPALFDKIGKAIESQGYAGDLTLPKTIYIALTSRLLDQPQNLHLVAPSAAGKSFSVNTVLKFFPEDAYYYIRAGSSRALIYNEEIFEHRFVIVGEADSIPEDGPAASAIRSIASDNFMEYEVVERDEETGKFATRKIHKEGPTGLITTSLKSMREQMSTRVLEMGVPDDIEQTKAILKAQALSVSGKQAEKTDPAPFIALQNWLSLTGKHDVSMPFASTVFDLLPDQILKNMRMRRDFLQLLSCTRAVALLYQAQRKIDPEGRVIASLDDYTMAYKLMEPLFEVIAAEGLTPAIRKTVAAVKKGEEISAAELAARLDLSKSTVSWRMKKALNGGWLVNKAEKEDKHYKLALGAPMPEEISALPSPEKVKEQFECSSDFGVDISPSDSFGSAENTNKVVGISHTESHSYIRTGNGNGKNAGSGATNGVDINAELQQAEQIDLVEAQRLIDEWNNS